MASHEIIDIDTCPLLSKKINENLYFIRSLLEKITSFEIQIRKAKSFIKRKIESGDVWITEADNGLDVVLEFDAALDLRIREIIFSELTAKDDIIRISHRLKSNLSPEVIMEKAKPCIKIAGYDVFIPAGTFLQPSKAGEQTLIELTESFLAGISGKIADLFCGVGTFSYALAKDIKRKIIAVDSSCELLTGFRESLNRQMIGNVKIENRNLFKYPLKGKELYDFAAIVFDPPRSGAKEQVKEIAALDDEHKPHVIVAISCNPHTFARDADILIAGGYELKEVRMVDQFIYSNHCELVAGFIKRSDLINKD